MWGRRPQAKPKPFQMTPEMVLAVESGNDYESLKTTAGWSRLMQFFEVLPNEYLERIRLNESNDPMVALRAQLKWQAVLEVTAAIRDEVDEWIRARNEIHRQIAEQDGPLPEPVQGDENE